MLYLVQDYVPKQEPQNPCIPSPCGINSQCLVKNEKALCSCLPEMHGNPPNCHPECATNSDCSSNHVCLNQKCSDPCPGSCGNDAKCEVKNHVIYCSCPTGFSGDPFSFCYRVQECKKINRSVEALISCYIIF